MGKSGIAAAFLGSLLFWDSEWADSHRRKNDLVSVPWLLFFAQKEQECYQRVRAWLALAPYATIRPGATHNRFAENPNVFSKQPRLPVELCLPACMSAILVYFLHHSSELGQCLNKTVMAIANVRMRIKGSSASCKRLA